jgi:hypothetical protein
VIALAHIVVTRLGHVGLLVVRCPYCCCEHVHGGYRPYDIRQTFKAMNGWRSPHCDEAPDEYQLKQEAGPARYAPGAECSARAHATMNYLDSIGIKTSNDTIH